MKALKSGYWRGARDFLSDNNGLVAQMPRECYHLDPLVPGHGHRPDEFEEYSPGYRRLVSEEEKLRREKNQNFDLWLAEKLYPFNRQKWLEDAIEEAGWMLGCFSEDTPYPPGLRPGEREYWDKKVPMVARRRQKQQRQQRAQHQKAVRDQQADEARRAKQQERSKRDWQKKVDGRARFSREHDLLVSHVYADCRPRLLGPDGYLLPDDHPLTVPYVEAWAHGTEEERRAYHSIFCPCGMIYSVTLDPQNTVQAMAIAFRVRMLDAVAVVKAQQ